MLASRWCALCFCVLIPSAFAASQDRIRSINESDGFVSIHGSVTARAAGSVDRGAVPEDTPIDCIRIEMAPTSQQQTDLELFLERQRDPSSPDYQLWLTPEEYADRFGVTENDMAQVRAWLEANGFNIEGVARGRNWIAFSATGGQIHSAFQTEIHQYAAEGELHFANATEPLVPARFAGVVTAVRGLDDFRPHPQGAQPVAPDFNAANGSHYLAPNDLAAIYDISPLYAAGYNGAGQKLAVVGQTDISLPDLRAFRTQFDLAAADPQLVLFGADPGVSAGDQIEADLDLEWSGAVARNAKIYYVYSQSVISSLQYAVDQNLAPVISMSYGECESGGSVSFRTVAQQANAQGITWLNASGDSGAAGCDWNVSIATHGPSVGFPSDIPEVTAVGGTEFDEGATGWNKQNALDWSSASGYLPETAWNDTTSGSEIEASTGGASKLFAKPSWQTGPGVPADGARDVPDISLSASANHDGYLIYANGTLMVVGGTSASTPSFAGIVTLINQYVVAKGLQAAPGLGNINPVLYNMARTTIGAIHDITTGSNIVPCAAGTAGCVAGFFGFKAGAGYDMVTGLGSVDAWVLAEKWNNAAALGTTMTLSASPASIPSSGSAQLTAVVTPVSGTNPPSGSVTFTVAGVSTGSAALAASGSKATATLTLPASSLKSGANTVTATYEPTANFASSSATAAITVAAPPLVSTAITLLASPNSIAPTASLQLTATVKPASGTTEPAGTIAFTTGNISLGSASLSAAGVALLTVKGSLLETGNNTIVATYSGSAAFSGSSATTTVSVTAVSSSTVTTLTTNVSTISTAATAQLTAIVVPGSAGAAPSGTVTFTAGKITLGSVSLLSVSGAMAAASLTVSGKSLTVGSNSVTAAYSGSAAFAASTSAPVTLTVSSAPAAPAVTTAVAVANPSSFAANATTQITVTVKAATGTAIPAGTVTFTSGKTALGTAALAVSGSSAIAILGLKGSSLVAGPNTISAAYGGSAAFAPSTAALTVTVTPPVATVTTLIASPATLSRTASTKFTATVKAAAGSAPPTGTITFTSGKTTLGTASLTAANSTTSVASMTFSGASLPAGVNTIGASYQATGNFANSAGSASITISPAILTSSR